MNLNDTASRAPPTSIATRGTWVFRILEVFHLSTGGLSHPITLVPIKRLSCMLCKCVGGASYTIAKLMLIVMHT